MKHTKNGLLLAALFVFTLFASGCATQSRDPIPPAGTAVSTTSEVFRQAARGLQPDCGRFSSGCRCTLDGIETSCSLVFACLDSGNCERVAR
ncbi:MAG: hypothetical protein ACREUM_08685 [Nitrosospira sp.]